MSPGFGIALHPSADFARAALPLLQDGTVDVLEYSFDAGPADLPDWATATFAHFAQHGALLGHGVWGCLYTGSVEPGFGAWLDRLAETVRWAPMESFSEHVGLGRSLSWRQLPPLPVPPTRTLAERVIERLSRIRDVVDAPVGLENLALTLSPSDLDGRGDFLECVLDRVDGFLHLDLHNLWCAACNYDRDPVALMERYPLHRVRRIHMAGGSWSTPIGSTRPWRRDTHDDAVPNEVHALLSEAVSRCPELRHVVLEQIPGTVDPESFAADARGIKASLGERPPDRSSREAFDEPAWTHDIDEDAFVNALAERSTPEWPPDIVPAALDLAATLIGRWGQKTNASTASNSNVIESD